MVADDVGEEKPSTTQRAAGPAVVLRRFAAGDPVAVRRKRPRQRVAHVAFLLDAPPHPRDACSLRDAYRSEPSRAVTDGAGRPEGRVGVANLLPRRRRRNPIRPYRRRGPRLASLRVGPGQQR